MSYLSSSTTERDSGRFVSPSEMVSRRTEELLATKGLELFSDPQNLPNDDALLSQLVRPLESYWGATDVYSILQSNPTAANFCGKVFKNGEPAVFCKCVKYELLLLQF